MSEHGPIANGGRRPEPDDGAAQRVVDAAHRALGSALRSVSVVERDVAEVLYVREDVAATLSEEGLPSILNEHRLAGVTDEHQERLYELGGMGHEIRSFERASVLRASLGETTGAVVTFDRDADGDPAAVTDGIRACIADPGDLIGAGVETVHRSPPS